MSTETQHYDEKYKVEEWNRAIPAAGYIKLGALRYGVRLSKLNSIAASGKGSSADDNFDSQSASKQQITLPISTPPTSLIMSPSSAAAAISGKSDFCNESCCCCISSTSSNALASKSIPRNSQLSTMSAKNRAASSPSSASSSSSSQKLLKQQQQQQREQRKSEQSRISSSVSSSNFKREASPTVCCYYIQNRSQSSTADSFAGHHSERCRESNGSERPTANGERASASVNGQSAKNNRTAVLRDKIKRFEYSEVGAEVVVTVPPPPLPVSADRRRPVYRGGVSENNNNNNNKSNNNNSGKRIYDDDKNSNFSTFLINRDERQQQEQQQQQRQQQLKATATQRGETQKFIAQSERCKLKYVNDSNNNQVKSDLVRDSQNCASAPASTRHHHETLASRGDDIKVARVIIRHLEPSAPPPPPPPPLPQQQQQHKRNILDDNDFSFIDSSSQSVSRSSSTSFASDEFALNENLRKLRIPKRISSRVSRQEPPRTSSAHTYLPHDKSVFDSSSSNIKCASVDSSSSVVLSAKNRINGHHRLLSEDEQQIAHHQSHLEVSIDQTIPENSTTAAMEKGRRNTLQKFGFGRKQTSSSASSSPERTRKPSGSKTERLKELTEKLKGHKSGSFKFSRSVSPPAATPPTPPPLPALTAPIPPPRKFKRSSQDASSAASSTDNLDNSAALEHHPDLLHIGKSKSVEPSSLLSGQITRQLARFLRPNTSASNLESLNRARAADDFAPKLAKPESRTVVGSYMQRNIPFRSASFSQADFNAGKYARAERSPSPPAVSREPSPEEASNQFEPEELFFEASGEQSSKRNSDIDTIAEEPAAERLAEQHSIEDQLNVVQALETLIEEEPPLLSVSPKTQRGEQLQQATTCLIPIPVFECVEKEWAHLPEHGGEEFCHPISEDVLPQAEVIENFIEIRNSSEMPKQQQHIIPEVELNNVALQLDEITEKLREDITPHEEVCNVVKTQIPQSKEALVAQKSFESVEEIRISPEIQAVLETVAETLNEEHKFLTNAIGNANINIVNLICPDLELSSERATPEPGGKFDLLKAMESSPEPGSFDKSDTELPETTVRKRHSNDGNSGSDKSPPNASPGGNGGGGDDKRRLDKSRRRKGIYIQWPALERSQDTSFEYSEESYAPTKQQSLPVATGGKKKGRGLEFCFSEPTIQRQSESMGSEPYTPESEHSTMRHPMWPKSPRRQSLTYQSSDERDDPSCGALSPPVKQYRNVFQRSESISDNESDRGSSRDRISSSPAPGNEQDLKRYSKRPLRGPYGQMLEAEMKKPTKVHYDGILEELCRSDSIKKSNCSLDSTASSSGGGFFNRNFKSRKSGSGSLPVPMHQRAGSSPVPLIETPSPDALPSHKKYPSSVDQRIADSSDHLSYKSEGSGNSSATKKLSLDSHLAVDQKSPKRTSSDISDKHSKKSYGDKVQLQKRSFDEIRLSTATPSEKSFVLNTPETPKNMAATPELLAELLKGSSEKILNEQTSQNKKHQMRSSGGGGGGGGNSMGLPLAVLNNLNNLDTRTHVVVELFNTEKSYVESLQTVVLKYLNPLKLPENSGIVDVQTVDEIFFMVPSILNIHERYLEELRKRLDAWEPLQCIGDVYYDVFSKPIVLETYIAFVNNWNKAKDAIRTTKSTKPAFAKFLEAMAREHKGKLSLDNLLIKPVQKFPNYELIFQRLIKHTDADHPDLQGCRDALKLVHDILVQLNCKEREALENGQREATLRELENVIEGIAELVSSERAFVNFELVSMPSGQAAGRKERGFFLFTDLLVITSIKKRSGTYRKPNSMPGSFSSTLDTNKYKFLTKIPLDDLEIVKSKDENVRRIMKEIEQLIEDSNKLQQILDLTSTLRCQHQLLEESVRDLQLTVQRQLAERQANDSQLNVLELSVNGPSGTQQNMSIVFSKPEKRTQWEETFTETKQKLIASIERFQVPEFIASVPIRKTRAGLQFTCAAATLGSQKDVWVCNSDGYVGQVCVLSLNQPEPTVTSCNGVCNARILCVTSVPGNVAECNNNNLNNSSIISSEDANRSSLLSISNASTVSAKTIGGKSTESDSNIQLDSSSSSDSEAEAATAAAAAAAVQERSVSPSTISNASQPQQQLPCDDSESQMWLGTEDGFIHVYNCTDNIRIKKNKIKIQHASAVYSILYLDRRVFVSLANGDICVYSRKDYGWNTSNPMVLSIGSSATYPVTKLLNVYGKLWCAIANCIKVLNTSTLQVENNVEISSETKPISNMTLLNQHVWISLQNSATIHCCNVNNLKTICEVNLAPAVTKMLSNCDNIIQQHKAACLRVTSLLACKDIIWVGTSAGVLLTILAQNIGKGTPVVTGIPQGHTGHVRFLTSIELDLHDSGTGSAVAAIKRSSKSAEQTPNNTPTNINNNNNTNNGAASHMLIISGGDGFEDFRTTGTTTMNEIAGREDSTNHLLLWQQT